MREPDLSRVRAFLFALARGCCVYLDSLPPGERGGRECIFALLFLVSISERRILFAQSLIARSRKMRNNMAVQPSRLFIVPG